MGKRRRVPLTQKQIERMRDMKREGLPMADIAEAMGVCVHTASRHTMGILWGGFVVKNRRKRPKILWTAER